MYNEGREKCSTNDEGNVGFKCCKDDCLVSPGGKKRCMGRAM